MVCVIYFEIGMSSQIGPTKPTNSSSQSPQIAAASFAAASGQRCKPATSSNPVPAATSAKLKESLGILDALPKHHTCPSHSDDGWLIAGALCCCSSVACFEAGAGCARGRNSAADLAGGEQKYAFWKPRMFPRCFHENELGC